MLYELLALISSYLPGQSLEPVFGTFSPNYLNTRVILSLLLASSSRIHRRLMAFHDLDIETSLLITQLALQDIEEYNRNLLGVAGGSRTGDEDEQYAFRLQEEDFELYLRQQGQARDRHRNGDGDGNGSGSGSGSNAPGTGRGNGGSPPASEPALFEPDMRPGTPFSIISDSDDGYGSGRPQTPDLAPGIVQPSRASSPRLGDDSDSFLLDGSDSDSDLPPTPPLQSPRLFISQLLKSPAECIVCAENIPPSTSFQAPCGHYYCQSCLSDFVKASMDDESSFPPQCCHKSFPLGCESVSSSAASSSRMSSSSSSSSIISFMLSDVDLIHRLNEKYREFSVSPKDRVYCPNARCSVYVGALADLQPSGVPFPCQSCGILICSKCKQVYHNEEECPPSPEEIAEHQVRDLAQVNSWQTCPGCKQVVEKTQGCHHMVCRCKAEFCYGCGATWTPGTVCVCGQQPAA
ncbi:hypothetical protein VKT23_010936 [Stygiomarasmius scandens]|uniref:RBR-type E3 ubiquitin transferase n=1 Tax=Marasmiellus scandens TaxID=2682957 RepID=A0ABR1JD90_9AGAR